MLIYFSIVGSFCSVFLALPQAKRAYFKSTEGVSLSTYIGFYVIAVMWVPHGIFTDQPLLSASNILSSFSCFTVIYSIARDNKNMKILLYNFVATAIFLALFLVGNDGLRIGILISLTLFLRLPQMYKALFHKNIEGISVQTWVIAGIGNAHWLGAGILKSDLGLMIPTSFNTLFSVFIISVVWFRRRKTHFVVG